MLIYLYVDAVDGVTDDAEALVDLALQLFHFALQQEEVLLQFCHLLVLICETGLPLALSIVASAWASLTSELVIDEVLFGLVALDLLTEGDELLPELTDFVMELFLDY